MLLKTGNAGRRLVRGKESREIIDKISAFFPVKKFKILKVIIKCIVNLQSTPVKLPKFIPERYH